MYIISKLKKTKSKDKILKEARGKKPPYYRTKIIRITVDFLSKPSKHKSEIKYVKCWKKNLFKKHKIPYAEKLSFKSKGEMKNILIQTKTERVHHQQNCFKRNVRCYSGKVELYRSETCIYKKKRQSIG